MDAIISDLYRANDSLWRLCARNLARTQYPTTQELADAVRVANAPDSPYPDAPRVIDWLAVPAGTTILIPPSP